jgi:hypothetical protein
MILDMTSSSPHSVQFPIIPIISISQVQFIRSYKEVPFGCKGFVTDQLAKHYTFLLAIYAF